jgi:hypothetical protein
MFAGAQVVLSQRTIVKDNQNIDYPIFHLIIPVNQILAIIQAMRKELSAVTRQTRKRII